MVRPPSPLLLTYLAPCDPSVSGLTLAMRDFVLEEAPEAIESIFNGYAVTIAFSFTGKPLKDGFCHIVTYRHHVNPGFNRGALLRDPHKILVGTGKMIRHISIGSEDDVSRPVIRSYLVSAIEQANRTAAHIA